LGCCFVVDEKQLYQLLVHAAEWLMFHSFPTASYKFNIHLPLF
jgi:hypothetical protein